VADKKCYSGSFSAWIKTPKKETKQEALGNGSAISMEGKLC